MKTEKATIKLVLRTNKTLADGTHPIMLRVNWQGKRAEKASGYSCKIANWNDTMECLKSKGKDAIPNAERINAVILEEKHKAENILSELILKKIEYSAQTIIDYLKEEGKGAKYTKDLDTLVAEYIDVNNLKEETKLSIRGIVKHFKTYMGKEHIMLASVTVANAMAFGRWCSSQGFKNNTIRTNIQKMRALFNYAILIDILKENPFNKVQENKLYKGENNKQALTKDAYDMLHYYYLSHLDSWGKGKLEKKFLTIGSEIFALNVFFLSFEFQGLAPIDLAKLRSDNIETVKITDNNNRYIVIRTKRSKTKKEVTIAVKMDSSNSALITPYLTYMADHDFLLPILKATDDTDEKVVKKMRYAISAINKNLKTIWKDYNEWLRVLVDKYSGKPLPKKLCEGYFDHREIATRNITKDNIDNFLISELTTLYSARHTFATAFINSVGANTAELAQMMGRNVNGIDRYIKDLMTIQDILKARDKMNMS